MRLTVGPLPPAVYWRRRAAVLGVVLLFLIVVIYSCSGQDDPDRRAAGNASASPSAEPSATATVLTPESGAPPFDESSDPVEPADQPALDEPQPAQEPAPPADGTCSDQEIRVTPVPSQTTFKRGTTVQLKLRIRNVSDRTCSRDVGADLQELYITQGARKIWSSDVCGTAKGSDVRSFPPSIEHEYQVAWNGRESSRCDSGVATGPYPEPGEYQLFARLGTRLSTPVKLTITS